MIDLSNKAFNLLEIAKEQEESGDYHRAIESLQKSRKILLKLGIWGEDEKEEIKKEIDRLQSLITKSTQGSEQTKNHEDPQTIGINLLNKSNLLKQEGNFIRAKQALVKAKKILEEAEVLSKDEIAILDTNLKELDEKILYSKEYDGLGEISKPVHEMIQAKENGLELIRKGNEYKSKGDLEKASAAYRDAAEILITSELLEPSEAKNLLEEIKGIQTLIVVTKTKEIQIKGIQHLGKAKELQANNQYEEAIKEMTFAKEILINSSVWGEKEGKIIDSEIQRMNKFLNTENIEDIKADASQRFENAMIFEAEEKYTDAKQELLLARKILVDNNLWGPQEARVIDTKIERLNHAIEEAGGTQQDFDSIEINTVQEESKPEIQDSPQKSGLAPPPPPSLPTPPLSTPPLPPPPLKKNIDWEMDNDITDSHGADDNKSKENATEVGGLFTQINFGVKNQIKTDSINKKGSKFAFFNYMKSSKTEDLNKTQSDTNGPDFELTEDDDLALDPIAMLKRKMEQNLELGYKTQKSLSLSNLISISEKELDKKIEKWEERNNSVE